MWIKNFLCVMCVALNGMPCFPFSNGRAANKRDEIASQLIDGEAVRTAILHRDKSEEVQDILLSDATPLSLGIETVGSVGVGTVMTYPINRNTAISKKQKQTFTTYADNQPGVRIKVYEVDGAMAKYSNQLGKFELTGIRTAPKGIPEIDVTFDIDTNGITYDSAFDKSTGKESKTTIKVNKVERATTKDNNLLRMFELSGIPPAPRAIPQIEVTFDI